MACLDQSGMCIMPRYLPTTYERPLGMPPLAKILTGPSHCSYHAMTVKQSKHDHVCDTVQSGTTSDTTATGSDKVKEGPMNVLHINVAGDDL